MVDYVDTRDARKRIAFDLPEDAEAIENAKSWHENREQCRQFTYWYGAPPRSTMTLCKSDGEFDREIPRLVTYGSNAFCDITSSTWYRIAPQDADWIWLGQSENLSATMVRNSLPRGNGVVSFRRKDSLPGGDFYTNALAIHVVASVPEVSIVPKTAVACLGGIAAPLQLEFAVEAEQVVEYQWQGRAPGGAWFDIADAKSTSFRPETQPSRDRYRYRLRVRLSDDDPLRTCAGDWLTSNSVTVQLAEGGQLYRPDNDGDGFPQAGATPQRFCEAEPGWALDSLEDDCDDNDAREHPGQVWYRDIDRDGFPQGGDDDRQVACERPNRPWFTRDELLSIIPDCDDLDAEVTYAVTYYIDADGDGFKGYETVQAHCSRRPAPEFKTADELRSDVFDCNDRNPEVNPNTRWIQDLDDDGFGGNVMTFGCHPGEEGYKLVVNMVGLVDCDDSDPSVAGPIVWYKDNDGDGYPAASAEDPSLPDSRTHCSPIDGYNRTNDQLKSLDPDCDDEDADAQPRAVWYVDQDGDGYGRPFGSRLSCDRPGPNWTTNGRDGNDGNANVGAFEPQANSGNAIRIAPNTVVPAQTSGVGNFDKDDFTVELWFRTTQEEDTYFVAKASLNSATFNWGLGLQEGKVRGIVREGRREHESLGQTVVNDGEWHHVAYRRRGASFALWVDGVQEYDEAVGEEFDLYSDAPLILAGVQNSEIRTFAGEIDELRFWSSARSERDLAMRVHRTVPDAGDDLLNYWQFNESFPSGEWRILVDRAGGAHFIYRENVELVDSTAHFDAGLATFEDFSPSDPRSELNFPGVDVSIDDPEIDA
ncbi:MAG: LamG domain-containing protein, partial [Planctomycetota bacterium]